MKHRLPLAGIILCLAAVSFGVAVADDSTPAVSKNSQALTTGIVTGRSGDVVTIKTDEGKVYSVDAEKATVLLDRLPGNCMSLRVGDKMRVYGTLTAPDKIKASRVHVFLSETEASATAPPAPTGAGLSDDSDVRLPTVGDTLGSWRNRGLVLGMNYSDRMVTIATSKGLFVLDASAATIVRGTRTISLAGISQGDAVRIWGELVGLNKIRADRIELIGQQARQEGDVPLKPVSVRGQITNIDFPSFAFKIDTGTGQLRVLSDENTYIHFQTARKAFQDLAVGQTVKVTGIGSLTTGYVASEILIIGTPR